MDEVVFVAHFSHTGINVLFELDVVDFWYLHESCERLFKEFSNLPKGVVLLDPTKL